MSRLIELGLLFLRIGVTAFGGPAAHIAMMREEVVEKRQWLDDQHFLDLLGATNLIPGPNSSEMAIHIGYTRAGLPGLIVGGMAFVAPAFWIVLGFAWAYVEYGETPAVGAILTGIKPVILPIILMAILKLGKRAMRGRWQIGTVGAAVAILYLLGGDVLMLMLGAGVLVMVGSNLDQIKKKDVALTLPMLGSLPALVSGGFGLGAMFLVFLKVGLVMYGSGYTLFAFLHDDLVTRLGWLTESQLIDAIAVGQMTPGPLSTTATFIGYVLGGFPGAVLATLGIYIPSFILVALSNPLIPKLRESVWAGAFLDGVNAGALGAMAGVLVQLAGSAVIDIPTLLIALVAGLLHFRFKLGSLWLVIGGGIIGVLISLI